MTTQGADGLVEFCGCGESDCAECVSTGYVDYDELSYAEALAGCPPNAPFGYFYQPTEDGGAWVPLASADELPF